MTLGAWVLVVAVVVALVAGGLWSLTNGVFRGTHRVRGGFETGAERLPQPPADGAERLPQPPADGAERLPQPPADGAERLPQPPGERAERLPRRSVEPVETSTGSGSLLAGTSYDGQRGDRATLLQFSSAFCAPCRATRRTLAEVATRVPGVVHLEVDAESHLDLVRAIGVFRTPTTVVLDAAGREVSRATGTPRAPQVLAALQAGLS
jgi:thiol-disulfide isomerase/thioredoxin